MQQDEIWGGGGAHLYAKEERQAGPTCKVL